MADHTSTKSVSRIGQIFTITQSFGKDLQSRQILHQVFEEVIKEYEQTDNPDQFVGKILLALKSVLSEKKLDEWRQQTHKSRKYHTNLLERVSNDVFCYIGHFLNVADCTNLERVNKYCYIHSTTKSFILNRRSPKDGYFRMCDDLLNRVSDVVDVEYCSMSRRWPLSLIASCGIRGLKKPGPNQKCLVELCRFLGKFDLQSYNEQTVSVLPWAAIFGKNPEAPKMDFEYNFGGNGNYQGDDEAFNLFCGVIESLNDKNKDSMRAIKRLIVWGLARDRLFAALNGNYEELELLTCRIMIDDVTMLKTILHENLRTLVIDESSCIYIGKKMTGSLDAGTITTVKAAHQNGILGELCLLEKTFTNLGAMGVLQRLEVVEVDLTPSLNSNTRTSLIKPHRNKFGWLFQLLSDKGQSIVCPCLKEIVVDSSIDNSHNLKEVIEEMNGLTSLYRVHETMERMVWHLHFRDYRINMQTFDYFENYRLSSNILVDYIERTITLQEKRIKIISVDSVESVCNYLKRYDVLSWMNKNRNVEVILSM